MKKIVILIPTLTTGGGEKIAAIHANDLKKLGYDISIVVPQGKIHQKIDPSIDLYSGNSRNLISSIFFCKKQICKINPDIVLSYMERANFINCCISWRKKWKAIASIHTVPSVAYKKRHILNRIFISITMKILRKLNIPIICVSSGVQNELLSLYDITNTHLIPNYLSQHNENMMEHNVYDEKIVFCFIGRLNKIKGCDIFLEAISKYQQNINKENSKNKKFLIVGDGPEKNNLISLSQKLKITNMVNFLGEIKNPSSIFEKTDYLIVPSYVEGFGLVILEGLYFGCSIIYSECKYGPKEILDSLKDKCLSYPFADPSLDRELAIDQLSQWIHELNDKKCDYASFRNAMLKKYSKNISLQKIISLITD